MIIQTKDKQSNAPSLNLHMIHAIRALMADICILWLKKQVKMFKMYHTWLALTVLCMLMLFHK